MVMSVQCVLVSRCCLPRRLYPCNTYATNTTAALHSTGNRFTHLAPGDARLGGGGFLREVVCCSDVAASPHSRFPLVNSFGSPSSNFAAAIQKANLNIRIFSM